MPPKRRHVGGGDVGTNNRGIMISLRFWRGPTFAWHGLGSQGSRQVARNSLVTLTFLSPRPAARATALPPGVWFFCLGTRKGPLLGDGESGLFMAGAVFLAVDCSGHRPRDSASGLEDNPRYVADTWINT